MYIDVVDPWQLAEGCRQELQRVSPEAPIPEPSTTPTATQSVVEANWRAFSFARQHAATSISDGALVEACVQGMTRILERSDYIDADKFKELQAGTAEAGIGIDFMNSQSGLIVLAPVETAPAARAGIQGGDAIVQIGDTSTTGLSQGDAAKLLRGKPDTEVKLTVARPGVDQLLKFRIRREMNKLESVRWTALPAEIAYIRITQFQESTAQKLASALSTAFAENQDKLKGLILDLRNNPGGLLDSAVGVSAAFLPHGALITYSEGRGENSRMHIYASPEHYVRYPKPDPFKNVPREIKTVPMVVLVNRGTAGGSEIVAAALKDHRRATIVGERTYGNGVIQTILPLSSNTALKLAIARYYTPNGTLIDKVGVAPEVVLDGGKNGNAPQSGLRLEDDLAVTRAIHILQGLVKY